MKIRFQADADIDPDIRKGLLRREPAIDFLPAAGTIPDGTLHPEVLRIAAEGGRVLVSGGLRTMSVHSTASLRPTNRLEVELDAYDLHNRVQWLP